MFQRILCILLLGAALLIGCDTSSPGNPGGTPQVPPATTGTYPEPKPESPTMAPGDYPAPQSEPTPAGYPAPTAES